MLRCRRALPAMVAVVAVLVVLLLPARSAFAATIPAVPNTPPQDGVIGDGICSLREAVRNANADAQVSTDCPGGTGNDTITLAAGTYNLSVAQAAEPNDARGDLDLTDADGLTIQGAGAGATIVDANGVDRVFDVRAGIVNIADLTIRGGANASIEAPDTVRGGGGIYVRAGATLHLSNAMVTGNSADQGGGILSRGGPTTIANSTISGNTASGASGGGILNAGASMTITNSTISGNTVALGTDFFPAGGGVSNIVNAVMTIDNSTISGNTASGTNQFGGAGGGGIVNGANSTLTVTNSTITGNTATTQGGGGIDNVPAGGGAPTLNTSHVTLSGNQAPVGATIRRTSGTVNARAVIAANPLGSTNCNGTITSQGFNLEFPGTSCGFEVQADPQLGPLANNGGPTMTQALPSTSPAVDAVTAGCPPPPNDQRGVTRPQDGNPGGAVACDIGAFERSLGTLQFSSATYTVGEGGGTATITVTRTGGADDTVGATVTLGGGTATAGADYTGTSFPVSFATGETTKTVQVPIVDDALVEGDEAVNLTLGSPTGGATIGAQAAAVLTIQDNDTAAPPGNPPANPRPTCRPTCRPPAPTCGSPRAGQPTRRWGPAPSTPSP